MIARCEGFVQRFLKHITGGLRQLCPTKLGKRHLQSPILDAGTLRFHKRAIRCARQHSEDTMNSIIYIVGLVVIIGVILSYFGFR